MRLERLAGPELEELLARITRALVAAFARERILLFGSFARGDQNRASDVDLVIVARTDLPFVERIGRALERCYEVSDRVPVDVLVYTPREWRRMLAAGSSFAGEVLRTGRVLYERESESQRGAALAGPGTA